MTFTFITVCYNAATTLEATIRSVVEQTYGQVEYIIVDGASTDGTREVIERYAMHIDTLICEPDKGIYDAMNKGLVRATGDYVCFLNAGDALHTPNTLQAMVESIPEGTMPDVLYGETALVDEQRRFLRMRRLQTPEHLTWRSFQKGMTVCHQSFYVRRKLAPCYNLRYRYSADVDWCIRVMQQATVLHNTHLVLTDYLAEGTTTRHRLASLIERLRIMVHYYGLLPTLWRHIGFVFRLVSKP
ncbi:MAG: glycosyltransferase [Prevotellaceae bacterium]|jgi:glycosyltransferase involved in cell wall biosynthesis|nr:glycosyltransferase [Prevotellaceae bacterium]